jgi:hypothetical protein
MTQHRIILLIAALAILVPFLHGSIASAQAPCIAPDNGGGTVDLPANCPYTAPYEPMRIIEGLPPNTTIELEPIFMNFICSDPPICSTPPLPPGVCEALGGTMGGHYQCFEATLDLTVSGTGGLEGFSRHLAVPMMCEIHTGPRNPGDPVQTFSAVMYRLSGELFGDPDFCMFRVTAGTDYGLPSPGETTLEDLGGGLYNIDSFFDITYQIEFQGCPGSVLDGYMGTTTATVRLNQGSAEGSVTGACCKTDGSCLVASESYCQSIGGTYYGNDSACLGDDDGDGYDDLCYDPGTCLVPDNGSGTVDLPADCPYTAPDEPMYIIDGLPPNTTIELEPIFEDFFSIVRIPGGSLGGQIQQFDATLDLTVTGTGDLSGFNRHLAVPISCEVHTGPRIPGDPVQTFPSVMFQFQGELFGDPDFCVLRVRAGNDFGLPSPGYFTLTEQPGGYFTVDSFFDVMYQIEFMGCPGSVLDGYNGTTTASVRLKQGSGDAETPPVGACCMLDGSCSVTTATFCSNLGGTYNGDDTECSGDVDGDGYDDSCYPQGTCLAPDNGSGTVDLPVDCSYTAPYEPMRIIEGLPPNTTIELEPILMDFICDEFTACSMSMPPEGCEAPGGSMGGHYHCFEATLDLTVTGTGDLAGFNRHLAVPISCEVHTGSRNPGDPVQTFPTVMYRLSGELFGDPDFCTFRITAGTDYGFPSPGHATLEDLGGGLYNIDSFFDITYQIEFEGCPGSVLDSYAGTTTATVRLSQGSAEDSVTGACCRTDGTCLVSSETYCEAIGGTYYGDDSACLGDDDGDGYDDLCYDPGTCLAPDNGGGTVDLPADCPYTAPDEPMYIIDGLPPNTTIELEPIFEDFFSIVRIPGGSLGGQIQQFDATLDLTVTGTGDLSGFNRHLAVPISCEVHTGPRIPGDPIQTFASVMFQFQGELFGDPDFCMFRVRAGNDFGLPSPGYFTLTEQPGGHFTVDSFFDVMYQIEFEGCPGSVLDGYNGTTTASVRLKQGSGDAQTPPVGGCCELDGSCSLTTETFCSNMGGTYFGDGTECSGDGDGDGYDDLCYPQGTCLAPDNGSDTVDLPADCPYVAPDEPMYIIDGFPPGTTIELDPIFEDFFCSEGTDCSLTMPQGKCEDVGGSIGGHYHCFEGALYLDVSGTGSLEGFNRYLAVPISCEVHTAPRNPGDPVQTFPALMYRFSGELFGDPDFCTFRIRAGSDYGLPGPGQMMLTDIGNGLYNVDSFFDITYQVEFQGCPGSQLDGYAGTTTATVRLKQGSGEIPQDIPTLSEWGMMILALLLLAMGTVAVVWRRKVALSKAA